MKRFICILAITIFIGRAIAQNPLPTAAISASSQQRELTAAMAIDGKMDTRWSSDANDEQWLQIDFNSPVELVGLTLHWETAYGRDYEIELLNPEGKWYSVSEVHFGDGGIDEIYFGLKKTKAIRLVGHKRGTGWGYSLWEIGILGAENQIFAKASCGTDANAVLDGNDKTVWTAGQTGVSVRNLQTGWGAISYTLKRQSDGQTVLTLKCSKQPVNGFVVPTGAKLIIKNNSEITN